MSGAFTRWNLLATEDAINEILPCCGSRAWAELIAGRRPFSDTTSLLLAADEVWGALPESDWREAFASHPRIGESRVVLSTNGDEQVTAPQTMSDVAGRSAAWSEIEQSKVASGTPSAKEALAAGNRQYELRFNRIFIVCAAGKSPEEILQILNRRLKNNEATELREAGEQQRQITQIRLRKWLEV